jgi:hypothetical protein
MPYIEPSERPPLDKIVEDMIRARVNADGTLNYILFKFCLSTVKPSYAGYRNFMGELAESAAEIRRRLLSPYEDQKIRENGDVHAEGSKRILAFGERPESLE